jgi:hypothetical protein
MKTPSLVAAVACGAAVLATTACVVPPDSAGGDPSPITECQVIDGSGPYVLAANLPGAGGYLMAATTPEAVDGDCILIVVSGVDLDLNAHTMTGDDDGGTDGSGVHALTGVPRGEHINIRNGLIRDFYRGINMEGVFFSVIEGVTTLSNDNHGISIHAGQSNHVRDNQSISNDVAGIRVSARSVVTNNIANGNGGVGVFVDQESVVAGNIAVNNDNRGLRVNCPGLVDGNVASGNGVVDLKLGGVAADCVAVNNVFGTSDP